MKTESSEDIDAIKKLAPKCPNGISCIKTGRCGEREMCTVRRSAGDSILFLEGDLPYGCPYLLPFGYGHFCTCPIHAKLYSKGKNKTGFSSDAVISDDKNK